MPATSADPLLPTLKQVFGYTAFRPLQEEIIRDLLTGRDVFALLPTGGGKSLCFQLPALVRPGLTVVISPLIALMKDQVDSLRANGVAATFLNSSLAEEDRRERWRGLNAREYRLLYLAPERLLAGSLLDDLNRWGVCAVAVDSSVVAAGTELAVAGSNSVVPVVPAPLVGSTSLRLSRVGMVGGGGVLSVV